MKVLVVLVLAVFTGCNANFLYADEPKSKLDELTDAFSNYAVKARQTAECTLNKIKQTEIGQNVEASITDAAHSARIYAETAWEQVPPPTREAMQGVGMLVYGMSMEAEKKISDLKKSIEPFAERLTPVVENVQSVLTPVVENVQSVLTQKAEQAIEMASPYVEKMKDKLDPMAQYVQTRFTNLF